MASIPKQKQKDRERLMRAFMSRTRQGNGPGTRITEDDPRWNASTMGNKTGWYQGRYYKDGQTKMPRVPTSPGVAPRRRRKVSQRGF